MSQAHYLLDLEIENISPFAAQSKLDLSDGLGNWRQWTVILGDNGTGKTTLLRILASLEIIRDKDKSRGFNFRRGYSGQFYPPFEDDIVRVIRANTNQQINARKIGSNPHSIADFIITTSKHGAGFGGAFYPPEHHSIQYGDAIFPIYSYGGNRVMSTGSLSGDLYSALDTLFDENAKLINAEEWLLQLDYAASKNSEIKDFAIARVLEIKRTLIDLMPDVKDIRFVEPTKEDLKPRVEFRTSFGWFTIHQLSLGYKSMAAWTIDLAARLFQRYPESANPTAEPAIVIVDEIDLHLHPKWQRRIFDFLSKNFVKTQFIVTSHSPLVAQAAPENANIVVLRKEDNYIVIDNSAESVHSWRIDQIMSSDLFDLGSSRGPEVAMWMDERKALIKKGDLTQEERERLDYLNKQAHALPTAQSARDIEAMRIINEAANYVKGS